MNASFYFNKSDEFIVYKDIEYITSANIIDRDGNFDLLHPSITVSNVDEADIFTSNYVYIDVLQRFYYVQDIQFVRNGVYRIHCSIDVLYTYRDYIKQQSGIVMRQENNFNMYLSDSLMRGRADEIIQTLKFPVSFNDFTGENIIIASA